MTLTAKYRIENFGATGLTIPKGAALDAAPASHPVARRLRERQRTDLIAVTYEGVTAALPPSLVIYHA